MHKEDEIKIYTDGSCDPRYRVGAWAAIILIADEQPVIIKGLAHETTHQRMELLAVINALKRLETITLHSNIIKIFTDSQYVVNLQFRKEKLELRNFLTKKKKEITNKDLLLLLLKYYDVKNIHFIKVKAHLPVSVDVNFNREVDMLCRKLVRENIPTTLIA